jgi:predicted ATP-dependent protease
MLDVDVVQAVEANKFSVQSVSTVQDAIELFTGKSAASILDAVRATLARFRKAAGFGL